MEHPGVASALEHYVRQHGLVRTSEIVEAGFPRVMLTRLTTRGRLVRLGKGLYSLPDHALTEWHDLAEASKSIPSAIVSLISALAFHEIGTQVPNQIWITLPEGSRTPTYHRPLQITRFREPYLSSGVENHQLEGVSVRVYGAAKTIADCFRMRSRLGYDVAVEALKDGWRLRKFTFQELDHYARVNRVDKVMRPYVETIIG